MSDLSSQISQILNNPEMMEQIKGLSGLLGQSAPDTQSPPPAVQNKPSPLDMLGGDGMQMAMKLIPIMNSLKQEDDTTRLLRAIKPFLSPQRQDKIEEAIKILHILKILPVIKSQGLLNLF